MGLTDGDFISYTSVVRNELERDTGGIIPVELNLVPKGSSETGRKTNGSERLIKEWDEQSRNLSRNFAAKLELSRERYIETLPRFSRRPRSFKGELEFPLTPVIVEARIPLPEMLKIAGIVDFFDLQELKDWEKGDFETPGEPYITWLTYRPNTSVEEVRASLGRNQRGGTVLDGIALFLKSRQILNHHFLKFPGSQVGSDYAPFLSALPNLEGRPNHPSLNLGTIDSKSPKFACLIASKI